VKAEADPNLIVYFNGQYVPLHQARQSPSADEVLLAETIVA
jgi:hypothetical protein